MLSATKPAVLGDETSTLGTTTNIMVNDDDDNNNTIIKASRGDSIRRTFSGMMPTRNRGTERKAVQKTRSNILLEPGCCDEDRISITAPVRSSRIWNRRSSATTEDDTFDDNLLYQLEGGLVGSSSSCSPEDEIILSKSSGVLGRGIFGRGGVSRCNSTDSTSATSTMSNDDYAAAGLSAGVDASDNYLWSN